MVYEDIYFLSYEEAYYYAKQQNKRDNGYLLQICYYDGEYKESDFINLVHLPIDKLSEILAFGTYRFPTKISFAGTSFSDEIKELITNNFDENLRTTQVLRNKCNNYYFNMALTQKPNFNEPLRFFLQANVNTQVMQYISKNIADTLKEKGFDVLLRYIYGIEDMHSLKEYVEFNPHVTININHLNNDYINSEVFNFVWFQDYMPFLKDEAIVQNRKRDYFFSYQSIFTNELERKGIDKSKIFKQEIIPVDEKEFYDKKLKRSKKIVFVGSFYQKERVSSYMTSKIDTLLDQILEKGESLTFDNLKTLFDKSDIPIEEENGYFNEIQQGYIRNKCVEWLCNQKDIEIYGYEWDKSKIKNIQNYFQGSIDKSELNNLYNTTEYVLAASGQVLNTQRLGELVHAGAIPVVYDSRDISDEKEKWDEECLYFKTKEDLEYILNNNIKPKKYKSEKMLNYFTYQTFLEKIFNTINNEVESDKK